MCQPRHWWWGLLPLALLWIAANLLRTGPVEADLAARAKAAFAQDGIAIAGQPWATATFAGRDGIVSGQSASADGAALAVSSAARAWGVRHVADASVPIGQVSPFRLSLRRDGGQLAWEGHIPPDATRLTIAAETKRLLADASVKDGLAFGQGAPVGLDRAVALMIAQAGRMSSGEITVVDTSFSLVGLARSSADYVAALDSMANLPAGFRATSVDLKPPPLAPYIFSLDKAPTTLKLSGALPDRATRALLIASGQGIGLQDQTQFASGAPAGMSALVAMLADWSGRLPVLRVTLNDGRLDVVGEASDWPSYDAVLAGIQSLPPGIALGTVSLTTPVQQPFTWSAARTGDEIMLGGHVPDEAARIRLMTEARALWPNGRVVDAMRVARGAPEGFDQPAAAAFAMTQLARLENGTAELTDRTMTLRGRAPDAAIRAGILDTLSKGRPSGLLAGAVAVTEPLISPYILSAERRDGVVSLQGHVPDEATREALIGIVRDRFLGDRIEDGLRIGAGAPADFARMARDLLGKLARLPSGLARISDKAVSLTGEALHERAMADIRGTLTEGLPSGWSGQAALALRPSGPQLEPDQCQSQLLGLMGRGRLQFETGRADIAAVSQGLLDNLAFVLNSCPQARVTIEGHTDSDGPAEFNLDLSKRRADAVAGYLATAGIAAQRLATAGFGATRPVASNDSEAGKARNRRIDFVVSQ